MSPRETLKNRIAGSGAYVKVTVGELAGMGNEIKAAKRPIVRDLRKHLDLPAGQTLTLPRGAIQRLTEEPDWKPPESQVNQQTPDDDETPAGDDATEPTEDEQPPDPSVTS